MSALDNNNPLPLQNIYCNYIWSKLQNLVKKSEIWLNLVEIHKILIKFLNFVKIPKFGQNAGNWWKLDFVQLCETQIEGI